MRAQLLPSGTSVYNEDPPPYPGTTGNSSDVDAKLPLDEVHDLVQPSVVFNLPHKSGREDDNQQPNKRHVAYVGSGGATSRTVGREPVALQGCPYRHTRGERNKRRLGKKTRASPRRTTNCNTCQCNESGLVIPNSMLVHYTTPSTCKIDQV